MKEKITQEIQRFVAEYQQNHPTATRWQEPLVGFADANSPMFGRFRELILPDHHMPQDMLPEANVVVCYFIPFAHEIPESNRQGSELSEAWSVAYLDTNNMMDELDAHMVAWLQAQGFPAALCTDALAVREFNKSRWSQRHAAWLAGLGTFGRNNMLITKKGCAGRYHSFVAKLPVQPDKPVEQEYCLEKRGIPCGACAKKCPVHAFDGPEFDRFGCGRRTTGNAALFAHVHACGKCVCGLPCTERIPLADRL